MPPHRFKKGDRKPPASGRRRGVRNKMTRELRENILGALAQAIKGETDGDKSAVEYLTRLARQKNKSLFVGLLGKTIEKKIDVKADLRETVRIVNLTGLNLADPKIRKRLGPTILGKWPGDEEKTK
jgi:hypothetical protein